VNRLGLKQNLPQFALLVLVNAFVGGMVGLERAILPALAEEDFGLAARSAVLSFIVVFGITKAGANFVAGRLSDRVGRRPVLLLGWALALPVPVVLLYATSWQQVVGVNALLGISQGLTWSTTVVMKIDLAGPRQRGLAMGLNEFAGYLAVGLAALASGYVAVDHGLRAPFWLGLAFAVVGLGLSAAFVRETAGLARSESRAEPAPAMTGGEVFVRTTVADPALSSATQAGFTNNLNDGLAWGLFPLVFAAAGLGLAEIGVLAALYPVVWGLGQLVTGAASDRLGRKPFIVGGMLLQAVALALIVASDSFLGFALASVLLGAGTAMVYPTLLAVVGDAAAPSWRGSAVGVYRLWRDSGYAAGALVAGLVADQLGLDAAVLVGAALTAVSGLIAAWRMPGAQPSGSTRMSSFAGPSTYQR